ncbi:MAG: hypothetical protein CM15mV137_110 [uncultured marine virus]|nr:MAG: hypothetical protein CM15mV137_110 [uncultured marine virus]
MVKTIKLSDGTLTTITYPNVYNYFLVVDGEIVKVKFFSTIENAYVDKCAKCMTMVMGEIDIIRHKLVNNKVVDR